MKKIVLLLPALLLMAGSPLISQSLDDVLKEHFAATGQDNLLKMKFAKGNRADDTEWY
ncbi:MAG: hypothetical protein R2756_14960 [Bacteroidales bacterium]